MRRFVLFFALGALCLQWQAALPAVERLLLAALAGLVLLAWRRRIAGPMAFVGAGFLLGFAWAALYAHVRLADRLAPELEGRDIEITGVVASLPQPVERGVRFEFEVESRIEGLPNRLSLTWYHGGDADPLEQPLHAGERWRFTVRLKQPHGSANPHGFDYELWLLERDIGATGYVRPRTTRERLDAFVYHPGYMVEALRETIRAKFHRALPEAPCVGALIALVIGDQRAIEREDWDTYTRTGVGHLMSISGLHVTMISGLCAWLVYSLWRRVPAWTLALPARKASAMGALSAAYAYCLLAGFAVPAQRTLYMVAVVALALYFDRMQSSSRVLCWALLLVLFLDPWAVTAPGFWLSFGAVALMLHVGVLDQRLHWLKRWLRVQGAITLGLAPLLLVLFQQVSLISPLANAIAIPVVSFVVTPLALLAALLPDVGLITFAHWVMAQLMLLLTALAQLPGAVWQQHAPYAWTAALATLGVLWMLGPRGLPARYCGALFLLPLFALKPPLPQSGEAWIDVLDVGQGLAVVIRTAEHAMVYDAGPFYSEEADAGNRIVLPYLRSIGLSELDSLMITHEDNDHAGGAKSMLNAMPTAMFWSSLPQDHELVRLAGRNIPCRGGAAWQWDKVRFEVLYPRMEQYAQRTKPNGRSCVLKITSGEVSMLLTGDIEAVDEKRLLEQPSMLKADVLLIPHHGSNTSSTEDFVRTVQASHAIAAAGYRNRFGHPKAEVLARYGDTRIWRTDRDGAVGIRLSAQGAALNAYRSERRRYWYK
ncbi:MAG TPA: DNA internalization-related competence protein ComEC/Rec2 [Burkholderiales bacterium]|nr:DNA internalization-related competence protein ComEC/Rec2 [Burkholderiales bacterium]